MDFPPQPGLMNVELSQPGLLNNKRGLRSGWRLLIWLALMLAILIPVFAVLVGVLSSTGVINLPAVQAAHQAHHRPAIQTGANGVPVWLLMTEGIIFVIAFAAAIPVAIFLERRPIRTLGLGFHSRWWKEFGQGLLFGVGLLSAIVLLEMALGNYRVVGFAEGWSAGIKWALIMGLAFLGVGLFEEFFFRGYLFQNLVDGMGIRAAAIVSSALFMIVHTSNPGENYLGIAGVLIAAGLLLVMVIRTRSLWLAVGFHAAWDWAQTYLWGVPDSGMVVSGRLLRTNIHGPAWFTGGTAGPEGSVVTLLAIGLLALYLARAPWLRPSPEAEEWWQRAVLHQPPPDQPVAQTADLLHTGWPAPEFDLTSPSPPFTPQFDLDPTAPPDPAAANGTPPEVLQDAE